MYKKVDANLNFPNQEQAVLNFWRENEKQNQKNDCRSPAHSFCYELGGLRKR